MATQNLQNTTNNYDTETVSLFFSSFAALVIMCILWYSIYHGPKSDLVYTVSLGTCSLIGLFLRIYILRQGKDMDKERLRTFNIVSHVLCIPLYVATLLMLFLALAASTK